jgi:hypothetical protein
MSNHSDFGDDSPLELLAETENYAVLAGEDAEGERVYNVELGTVTLHLFREEWDELVQLIKDASKH